MWFDGLQADATSRYGNALVEFDAVAERRLRLKIDFMIIPTVSLLYLFCFIDRANIGEDVPLTQQRRQLSNTQVTLKSPALIMT
jgi:hypothetical protein